MSVTSPRGFRASGIEAGLRSGQGPDLALVVNDGPSSVCSAVFTSNRAKANPILWSMRALKDEGCAKAVILNSGGANCFTGEFGYQTASLTAQKTAELTGCSPQQVQVCSTGIIGQGGAEFRAAILDALPKAVAQLSDSGGDRASEAILTTDTKAKTASYQGSGWSIGAMAKGAGMLAPGLATMLVVITTDADISSETAQQALRAAVERTFNRLDTDGCMSTNDQVTLMVSGASGIAVAPMVFETALHEVCLNLALQLLVDSEGSAHDISIRVVEAQTETEAVEVGRAIARSNLFKAAVFGNDPNWGRILAAMGTTSAAFDPYDVDVAINGVRVCSKGGPDRDRSEVDMNGRGVDVVVNLKAGPAAATVWTSDLTYDYVNENSAYSS